MIQTQPDQLVGATNLMMMYEFDALKRIPTYVVENRLKAALEAKIPHMAVKSNEIEVFDVSQRTKIEPQPIEEPQLADLENDGQKDHKLGCIYDDEPLGFEKDPVVSTTKTQP